MNISVAALCEIMEIEDAVVGGIRDEDDRGYPLFFVRILHTKQRDSFLDKILELSS
jgi:hypothetical protein